MYKYLKVKWNKNASNVAWLFYLFWLDIFQLILIGFSGPLPTSNTMLFVSEDGSKSWKNVELPFQVRSDEPIIPHHKKEDWLLALEQGGSHAVCIQLIS